MKAAEAKICQNCKANFTIESDDFEFYEMMKVPAPTFCPPCRLQRRQAFYPNFWAQLYKRKCDATGVDIISMFPQNAPFPVYENSYWNSDKWDATEFCLDIDFKKGFFTQLKELLITVPYKHAHNVNSVRCEYCVAIRDSRDCYMTTGTKNEFCCYSGSLDSKYCLDSFFLINSELCFECVNCDKCYRVCWAEYSSNCINCTFLYNCTNCQNCFGCVNLRNKNYCIFNTPYSKEEYEKIISSFHISSRNGFEDAYKKFIEFKVKLPHLSVHKINAKNSSGNNLSNTNNCKNCFGTYDSDTCSYCVIAFNTKDSWDIYDSGLNGEKLYEISASAKNISNLLFSYFVHESYNVTYSSFCTNCHDIFGCVGLRNKSYCILNKQYTKSEYEALIPEVIKNMNEIPYFDTKGRAYKYGEFFPIEISPIAYNKSVAYEQFPMKKDASADEGFRWNDDIYNTQKITMELDKYSSRAQEASSDILNAVFECKYKGNSEHSCPGYFRINSIELDILQKLDLPIPESCWSCRYYERRQRDDKPRLFTRTCECGTEKNGYKNTLDHGHGSVCSTIIETTYALNRPEMVYCEECYQKEII